MQRLKYFDLYWRRETNQGLMIVLPGSGTAAASLRGPGGPFAVPAAVNGDAGKGPHSGCSLGLHHVGQLLESIKRWVI